MYKEISEELLDSIYKKHIVQLNNIDVKQPKLIITFSGIQASGKTTISKKLEKDFNCVRVNNDDVRLIIADMLPDISRAQLQTILQSYGSYISEKLSKRLNGRLIMDGSVDHRFEAVKALADNLDCPLFIIRLEVPYEELKRRISNRNNFDDSALLKSDLLKEYYENYERSLDKFKPNVTIDAGNGIDYPVIQKALSDYITNSA
jgi:predicted kinase